MASDVRLTVGALRAIGQVYTDIDCGIVHLLISLTFVVYCNSTGIYLDTVEHKVSLRGLHHHLHGIEQVLVGVGEKNVKWLGTCGMVDEVNSKAVTWHYLRDIVRSRRVCGGHQVDVGTIHVNAFVS